MYILGSRRFYARRIVDAAVRALGTGALVAMALCASASSLPVRVEGQPCASCERLGGRMKGITLGMIEDNRWSIKGYGTPGSRWALEEIRALGATWTSITPYATMISTDDARVIPYFEYPPEELEERVRTTIRQSHAVGLEVLLIPHIYPWDWTWRGQLNPGGGPEGTPEAWDEWFDSYRTYMLGWADLAAEESVEMLSVGVEFKTASWRFRDRFALLAEEVRVRYPGLLVYSANWDEVDEVGFWDRVDVIGLNAFYPLSSLEQPDPADMMRNAEAFADSLELLARVYGKPVIFTEVGFKALTDSYREPWIWPEDLGEVQADDAMQALLFDITFAAYWNREWFGGLFVWKWLADPADDTQEPPFGFSPRLKPAQDVIESWFEHGSGPPP